MDEDAAVEEFTPVFFFGGVGDGCAEGFPDEWPWDGDVGKAVLMREALTLSLNSLVI